jgi:hypothetical protein
MKAQFLVTALVLLGPPATMVQTADLPQAPRTDDQTRRVRELIYFFRTYRVFSRDEEWAQTIRELAAIGKVAVPELVAELDRTDRDATIRSLAFCLRAIDDPRAVPALIRAIPKALRPPGSDCGVGIIDPELRKFMKSHEDYKDDHSNHVACGRPVNEILSALERITNHREPPDLGKNDPLRGVFLGGSAAHQAQQRALFEERRKRWQAWWSEHWRAFVTQEELHSAELPKRDQDLVELTGVARYGALFPTGASVRLGPVHMLRLTRSVYSNGKSHLDLDTGQVFQQYEGMKSTDWGEPAEFGSRITSWYRRNGIDVRCQGHVEGVDLLLWQIDDRRWDTLEAEIRRDSPLKLGPEATSWLVRFEKSWNDFQYDKLATFLFTTREGGRGIVQVFPKDLDADRYRVRYRMWLTGQAPAARSARELRRTKAPGTPFGRIVSTTLAVPAEERECLLDLEAGRKAVPPETVKPHELARAWSLAENRSFTRWCRDRGIDAFGSAERFGVPVAKGEADRSGPLVSLVGLDMIAARIVPQTFDDLSVEEARVILDRAVPSRRSYATQMMIDVQLTERPDTFALKTREGTVGVLQLEAADKEAGNLKIRYRLERRE